MITKGTVTGFERASSLSQMKKKTVDTPIAIGIDAECFGIRNYSSGVITSKDCPCSGKMNHSVTVVGSYPYEKDSEGRDISYWKV